MNYLEGDQVEMINPPNPDWRNLPLLFRIVKAEQDKNCFMLRNLQTQKITMETRESLDLFYKKILGAKYP